MSEKKTPGHDQPKKTEAVLRERYSLAEVFRLRDNLKELLTYEFGDRLVSGPSFLRLLTVVREALPVARLDPAVLRDSLRHLAGKQLTAQLIEETSHRLAGNLPRLRNRRPVVPWHGQRISEWVPLQVVAARPARPNRKGEACYLSLKILAGTACPRVVLQRWSLLKCQALAPAFGFTRQRRGKRKAQLAAYPFTTPEQLVTLRFAGFIERHVSGQEPVITEYEFPDSLLEWNREQLKHRLARHRAGYACPQGFRDDFACHGCPVGYLNCRAGTHRLDYVLRRCPHCRQRSPFDLEWSDKMCVVCYRAKMRDPYR